MLALKHLYTYALCLATALLASLHLAAQKPIYVHHDGVCHAIDPHNTWPSIAIGDTLDLGLGVVFAIDALDSITYRPTGATAVRAGWWGDTGDGRAACYYPTVGDASLPDMVFDAADGRCTAARYLLAARDGVPSSARETRRVGRRWQYVRNTLSGRRRLTLSWADEPYGAFPAVYDTEAQQYCLDMDALFVGKDMSDVARSVNYWYRPDLTHQMPSAPVFGTYNTMTGRYEATLTGLRQETVTVELGIEYATGHMALSDTLYVTFADSETAREAYALMDTTEDETTKTVLLDDTIIVIERFQITADEAMRWLTRFDLDLWRPVFIREEDAE